MNCENAQTTTYGFYEYPQNVLFRTKWHVDLFVESTAADGSGRNDFQLGAGWTFMTSIFVVLHAKSGAFGWDAKLVKMEMARHKECEAKARWRKSATILAKLYRKRHRASTLANQKLHTACETTVSKLVDEGLRCLIRWFYTRKTQLWPRIF